MKEFPERPKDMSQVDYLWLTYGPYKINEVSDKEEPEENSIATEKALVERFKVSLGNTLDEIKLVDRGETTEIKGIKQNGGEVSFGSFTNPNSLKELNLRKVTQEDIDNGFEYPINSDLIEIILSNGDSLKTSLNEFTQKFNKLTQFKAEVLNYTINDIPLKDNPVITKELLGLENVDNTSDEDKPLSLQVKAEFKKFESKLKSYTTTEIVKSFKDIKYVGGYGAKIEE